MRCIVILAVFCGVLLSTGSSFELQGNDIKTPEIQNYSNPEGESNKVLSGVQEGNITDPALSGTEGQPEGKLTSPSNITDSSGLNNTVNARSLAGVQEGNITDPAKSGNEGQPEGKLTSPSNITDSSGLNNTVNARSLTGVQEGNITDPGLAGIKGQSEENLTSASNITSSFGLNSTGFHAREVAGEAPFIFSAVRNCGVTPKVLPYPRFSNLAPGQYPWHAAIFISNASDCVYQCAGTLISESIVVTTASCILNYKKQDNLALKIVLGGYQLPYASSESLPVLEAYSKAAVLHPSFKEGTAKNNIGLIRLFDNVEFDLFPHIFPLCIVAPPLIDPKTLSTHCTVPGWFQLQDVNVRTIPPAYLKGGEVEIKAESSSVTGTSCVANEGSGVVCPGSSLRNYLWGIVASQPRCALGSSTTTETVSIFDNYDFISQFLRPNEANQS